ncbi:MAG: hypothetical protein ACRCXE_03070, partial [Metamycoplasmataceae bacterium]
NNKRILWGFLSLLLLGPIGLIIFANKNIGKYNDYEVLEINQEEKKKIYNKLRMFLIFELICLILGIVIFVMYLIVIVLDSFQMRGFTLLLALGTSALWIVINMVIAIIILTSKFQNEEVNNSRILWGLLSLLLLGPFGIIAFTSINIRKYSESKNLEITQTENESIYKKFKMLLAFGIIALFFWIVFIPLQVVSSTTGGLDLTPKVTGILAVVAVIIGWMIDAAMSIIILISDFRNEDVNKDKNFWGFLSLFLLGPIGVILFVYQHIRKYIDYENLEISQEEKKKIYKKLRMFLIFEMVYLILGFLIFIIYIIGTILSWDSNNKVVEGMALLIAVGITMIWIIINIVLSIIILASNFKSKEINRSKILWGLLSLFLLGTIGIMVFATINIIKYIDFKNKKINIEPQENNNPEITNNYETTVE